MALRQRRVIRPHHQRQVRELRRGEAERAVEQQLPRRVRDVILAPNHVRDLHQRIVDTEGYVSLHSNRYSVPATFIGRRVEVRETRDRIEIELDAREPGLFDRDLETVVGRPLEQLEFTFWYLLQRNLIRRGEQSRLIITVEGVDYLEQQYERNSKKRLNGHAETV